MKIYIAAIQWTDNKKLDFVWLFGILEAQSRASLKPLEHHGTIVPRGSRGAIKYARLGRETSVLRWPMNFFLK